MIVISQCLDGVKQEEIHHIRVSLLDFQSIINSIMVDKPVIFVVDKRTPRKNKSAAY